MKSRTFNITMTDDELELSILNEYTARHQEAKIADPQSNDKCALEIDMRDVIRSVTGKEGAAIEYTAELWLDRLTSTSAVYPKQLLKRCSNSALNKGKHRFHARAYRDPINNAPSPAWDRFRELELNLSSRGQTTPAPGPVAPSKELEQNFGILFSRPQGKIDFDDWLADAEDQGFSIGVLFIDIDHFKNLNSQYTETIVDETILPEFQFLLKKLTTYRGVAYRYGGEEFFVLLPNQNIDEVNVFAEKVRKTVESHRFQVADVVEQLTVSIGVAMRPDNGKTLNDLLVAANSAEHKAKEEGRNTVEIAPSLAVIADNNGRTKQAKKESYTGRITVLELRDEAMKNGWDFVNPYSHHPLDFIEGLRQAAHDNQITFWGRSDRNDFDELTKREILQKLPEDHFIDFKIDLGGLQAALTGAPLPTDNFNVRSYNPVTPQRGYADLHVDMDQALRWLENDANEFKGKNKPRP